MSDVLRARLGRGWSFPVRTRPVAGVLALVDGPELIRQSIRLILATEPGERVMRPDFGCGLRRFLMAPNTPGTRAAIGRAVEGAIAMWEPRVTVRTVEVTPTDTPSLLVVSVAYVHVRDGSTAGLQVPLAVNPSGA